MSPRICSCTLCGWVILDAPGNISWLNQFRGVSSSPAGVILTGVGVYDDPGGGDFIAPTDPRRRWDDPGYDRPEEDRFGAMCQGEVNGRHGFVFHEACWDLLAKASHPTPVPLTRLFDVCRSLPFPLLVVGLSWGHDYGGPVRIDDEQHFPWEEDRFTDREYVEPDPMFSKNPYDVPEVRGLLSEAPEPPPSPGRAVSAATMPERDALLALPPELRSAIAMYLPTSDVLNLRLASRAFWTILDSQQFWASRFEGVSERSWLFEARDEAAAKTRDWRWLYRRTNHGSIGPGLRNRARVWDLAQKILGLLEFSWVEVGMTDSPKPEPQLWTHVSGSLWERPAGGRHGRFDGGCRLLHKHRVPIPDDLSRLSVSCVRVGDAEYLAGLKLVTAAGASHQVGYWRTAIEKSTEVSEIRGFKLAAGSRGIQALQCTVGGSNTDDDPWLGSTERSPKTHCLDVDNRVTEIEVGFDGCKMVSFAVCHQLPSPAQAAAHEENRLRSSGMWYPDVPGPSLCLNEDLFPPRDHYLGAYQPLFWTSFGGPGGVYLRSLTGLSVVWGGGGGVRRIDFAYDVAVPPEHRAFGCQMPGESTKTIDFAVDGPGGEIIEAVEVFRDYPEAGYRWMVKEGTLAAFRVMTNRGSSCLFSLHPDLPSKLPPPVRVAVAPGTSITGFYGSQRSHDGSGITTLGVISEVVERREQGGSST